MPIDMSAAKAPPKKRAGGSAPAAQQQVQTLSRNELRRDGMLGLAQLVQGGLLLFGQFADAGAIGQHFPPIASELSNIADTNETVAKPIDILIEVGPYGALIAAVLPFGLQLAANHRLINASMLAGQGVVPPEVLEAQMKAQVMQMQADAMRKQQQAVQAAQQAQKDLEEVMNAGKPAA